MKDSEFALKIHRLILSSTFEDEGKDELSAKLESLLRLKRDQEVEDFYHPRDMRG